MAMTAQGTQFVVSDLPNVPNAAQEAAHGHEMEHLSCAGAVFHC